MEDVKTSAKRDVAKEKKKTCKKIKFQTVVILEHDMLKYSIYLKNERASIRDTIDLQHHRNLWHSRVNAGAAIQSF